MGTGGDCHDNAPLESFQGSEQNQLLNRQRWRTNLEVVIAMVDTIEHLDVSERRHSSLGHLTPNGCEELHSTTTQQTTLSYAVDCRVGPCATCGDHGDVRTPVRPLT